MSQITTGQLFAEWQQMNQKLLTQIEKQNEIIANQQALIDRFNSPIDTQLTGSYVENDYIRTQSTGYRALTMDTAFDSEVIEPGSTANIPIPIDGASKLVILVSINQKWIGSITTVRSASASDGSNHIYPNVYSEVQERKSANYPQRIIVGLGVHDASDELDAINRAYLHKETINFLLKNQGEELAVGTVRVIRMWEG